MDEENMERGGLGHLRISSVSIGHREDFEVFGDTESLKKLVKKLLALSEE